MPECLECKVLQKARYINTLTFTLYLYNVWYGKTRMASLPDGEKIWKVCLFVEQDTGT